MPSGFRKDGTKLGFQKGNQVRLGKFHPEKTRKKMRISRKKWLNSKEGKNWLKNATHFGKYERTEYHREIYRKNGCCMIKHTEKAKKKISQNVSGKKNGMYGKKHTVETKLKMRKARLKQKLPKVSSIELTICRLLDELKIKYIPQYPILIDNCATIIDVFVPDSNLCIYCDGDYWHNLPDYIKRDRIQNKVLTKNKYKVLRLWEHEIKRSLNKCKNKILKIYENNI